MTTEDRLLRLENAFVTLTDLAESIDRRLDTHDSWINRLGEAQAHTEERIAALIDAQVRTEDALARLAEAQASNECSVATLTRLADEMDARLSAVEGRNGQP
jgi:DNA repair exonuclease SbcCD ATPase subunit